MIATFSTAVIVRNSFAAEPDEPLGDLNGCALRDRNATLHPICG
jgi:hypothetical protein